MTATLDSSAFSHAWQTHLTAEAILFCHGSAEMILVSYLKMFKIQWNSYTARLYIKRNPSLGHQEAFQHLQYDSAWILSELPYFANLHIPEIRSLWVKTPKSQPPILGGDLTRSVMLYSSLPWKNPLLFWWQDWHLNILTKGQDLGKVWRTMVRTWEANRLFKPILLKTRWGSQVRWWTRKAWWIQRR